MMVTTAKEKLMLNDYVPIKEDPTVIWGIFRKIAETQVGDEIEVTMKNNTFVKGTVESVTDKDVSFIEAKVTRFADSKFRNDGTFRERLTISEHDKLVVDFENVLSIPYHFGAKLAFFGPKLAF